MSISMQSRSKTCYLTIFSLNNPFIPDYRHFISNYAPYAPYIQVIHLLPIIQRMYNHTNWYHFGSKAIFTAEIIFLTFHMFPHL